MNIDPTNLMLYVIVGFALAELRRAFIAHRERVARLLVPQPDPEPAEIGWCFVVFKPEGEAVYGLVRETVIGGKPWIRVSVPGADDGLIGDALYPLHFVRWIDVLDEETCREMAAEDQADADATDLPPIGVQAVDADKPN